MSWESGVMGLSTVLNAQRPDAFTPYKRTTESRSLKSDIAVAKGFGCWGVLSCAQMVSIKNKNKNIYGLNLTKNKNIETQQNFTGS